MGLSGRLAGGRRLGGSILVEEGGGLGQWANVGGLRTLPVSHGMEHQAQRHLQNEAVEAPLRETFGEGVGMGFRVVAAPSLGRILPLETARAATHLYSKNNQ